MSVVVTEGWTPAADVNAMEVQGSNKGRIWASVFKPEKPKATKAKKASVIIRHCFVKVCSCSALLMQHKAAKLSEPCQT